MTYSFQIDNPDYKEPTAEEKRATTLSWHGVTDQKNTFENMRHPPGFENTFKAFSAMANGSSWYMLLDYGGSGNGKSKCCEALVISLYDRGLWAKRHRWSDIVRHLKGLMSTGGYESYFNLLRDLPCLIIDDVGGGSTLGNWEWGELEDIVDYRLEKRLFTVITTNLDGKEIPPRIISRFKDKSRARLVRNEASDQRPLEV